MVMPSHDPGDASKRIQDIRRKYGVRKPFLIRCLIVFFCFGTITAILFLLLTSLLVLLESLGVDVRYTYHGQEVRHPPLSFSLKYVFLLLFSAALAYVFWKEKLWARHIMVVYGVLALILSVIRWDATSSIGALLWIVFFGWYFYAKDSVQDYYQRLAERQSKIHEHPE